MNVSCKLWLLYFTLGSVHKYFGGGLGEMEGVKMRGVKNLVKLKV